MTQRKQEDDTDMTDETDTDNIEIFPQAPDAQENGGGVDAASLREELVRVKDQMIRALAEAENGRKRALKEREEASKYAIAGFARDMVEVANNLRRALASMPENPTDPQMKTLGEGVSATERVLLRSLEKNNVRKIDPLGEVFNPNFHEVMFETPGTGQPPGTVIQVLETGYMLGERLLRPARVGVAKSEGAQAPPPGGGTIDTQA